MILKLPKSFKLYTNSFLIESSQKVKTTSKLRIYRAIVAFILVTHLILMLALDKSKYLKNIFFFTHWGYWMVTVYFIINTIKDYDTKQIKKVSSLFHVSLSASLFVAIGFWMILIPIILNLAYTGNFSNDEFRFSGNIYPIYKTFYLHTFPTLSICIDSYYNKFQMNYGSFTKWFNIVIAYTLKNFFATKFMGIEIYPGFDYMSLKCYFAVFCGFLISISCWYLPLKMKQERGKTSFFI